MRLKSKNLDVSYKLARARAYLRKAKRLLDEVEMLNSKLMGDFYAIEHFCSIQEMQLEGENEYRADDNDQRSRRKEAE